MDFNNLLFSNSQNHTKQNLNKENFQKIAFKGELGRNNNLIADVRAGYDPLTADTAKYQFYKEEKALNEFRSLSNPAKYTVLINGAGLGKSTDHNGAVVNRGSDDNMRNPLGSFFYLRENGKVWSAGLQPTLAKPDKYETAITDKKAIITRHDGPIKSELQVAVAPNDNAEVRRVVLSSTDGKDHDIEITSYNETSLFHGTEGHPAFNKLFVETKYNDDINGIIASRRPRGKHDKQMWAVNKIRVSNEDMATGSHIEYETARENFIGRNRTVKDPVVMDEDNKHLSNKAGIPLDPVASLRTTVHIKAGTKVNVDFTTISGDTEKEVVDIAKKYIGLSTKD